MFRFISELFSNQEQFQTPNYTRDGLFMYDPELNKGTQLNCKV